jgi:DNA helicase II / ATP-dependent DNA helicase PcrA
MTPASQFEPPEITNEDIAWACSVLALPETAFSGADGKDLRLEVLKLSSTLDIEACPGSGKTTLLVAKLAILARKWTESRCGTCVLSHTNVARREIEKRLGGTAAGQRLLAYPHYVGTIHGFVNEFLALPWLRSLGFPVRVIDSSYCEQHRRRLLALAQFSALANYVNAKEASDRTGNLNIVGKWRVASPGFEVLKENGEPEFKDKTGPAARQLRLLAEKCVCDGYYCYDEMFMWAHDLIDKCPDIRIALRRRFPMLFIDEVQDNNEHQSKLLYRLFMEGEAPVRRQRYGDSNQAIYGYAGEEGATTDIFPDQYVRRDIPNSHRFGQQIADFADPLGIVPHKLVGCGPQEGATKANTANRHAIILFDDQTIDAVIPGYADYLSEIFSADELQTGDFPVVAAVHRAREDNKIPRHLGHYWRLYDPELTIAEPKPKTFYQYVMAGRKRSEESREAHHVVEKTAEGLLRLARLSHPTTDLGNRKRTHRQILERLCERPAIRDDYLSLVTCLAAERLLPGADEWLARWQQVVKDVAEAIGGGSMEKQAIADFLVWQPPEQGQDSPAHKRDNVFRHPPANPRLQLRLGSIHSVKGETHTATLVVDSYFRSHHLLTLKPWLLGQRAGKENEGPQNQSRLKQHYVAMTRPAHLLCLAMRADAVTDSEIQTLQARGWRIAHVCNEGLQWL